MVNIFLSPLANAVVSSNNANVSYNWTNAASWSNNTVPGTTNAGVTNNADTAIFTTLTNQTVTLNNDLNIQNITFNTTSISNTVSGAGTLLLTTGGTILNSSSTASATNTIGNNIAFVGGAGTYTFNSANNNNSNGLSINGNITSSNTGTETMVVGVSGSNLKMVFGGNITDTVGNMINIIAGSGGNLPSTTTGTNNAGSGLYFTGNNSFNTLQVGGNNSASVYLILTGSNNVRNAVKVLPGTVGNNVSSLVVGGANGYLTSDANAINVGAFSELVYDNTTSSVTNRIGSATVSLNGGRFIWGATNTALATIATVQQISLGAGLPSYLVDVAPATGTNTLILGSITNGGVTGATLQTLLPNSSLTSGRVVLTSTNSSPLTGGILAWGVDASSGNFLSYTNLNGTNFLGAYGTINGAYTNAFSASTTTNDNVKFTSGSASLSSNATVNSLSMLSSGANTLSLGANTLTLNSGGLLFTGNVTTVNGGAITVGTGVNTLYLWDTATASTQTLSSSIIDNGSPVNLVYRGGNNGTAGILYLAGSNSYTGQTLIETGTLALTNNGTLKNSTNTTIVFGSGLTVGTTNPGIVSTNVTLYGTLTLANTNGALTISGINGVRDTNYTTINNTVAGSATIASAASYNGTNSVITTGVGGDLLILNAGGSFLSFTKANNSYATLTQSGTGTVSFGIFGQNTNAVNSVVNFSGGNWFLGQTGFNGTGAQDAGTNNITNGAAVTISGSQTAFLHGIWNIGATNPAGASTLTIQGAIGTGNANINPLQITVNTNGYFASAGTWTLGIASAGTGSGGTNLLAVAGGAANVGGTLQMGANAITTNDINQVNVAGGSLSINGNLTLGGNTANTGETNTVTLSGGSLTLVNGALAPNSGTGESNTFLWTGGTMNAAAINASNIAGQSGWTGAAAGSSISNNTLYNTNTGTLAVGNSTNNFAGKTIINGNYTQSGSTTTTFKIFGTTQASTWAGATNQYSFLSVSSNATVGGTISLLPSLVAPITSQTLSLLTAGGAGGLSFSGALGGTNVYNAKAFNSDQLSTNGAVK